MKTSHFCIIQETLRLMHPRLLERCEMPLCPNMPKRNIRPVRHCSLEQFRTGCFKIMTAASSWAQPRKLCPNPLSVKPADLYSVGSGSNFLKQALYDYTVKQKAKHCKNFTYKLTAFAWLFLGTKQKFVFPVAMLAANGEEIFEALQHTG